MAERIIQAEEIMGMIPHRYPLLLVDRVLDVEPGESAVALKNVTINEDFFNGHFPGAPVMPGVLIIEALAQTCALMVVDSDGQDSAGKLVYFMAIDDTKFRKPVVPGDQLKLHVKKIQNRRNVWKLRCEARVEDKIHAEATLTAMIMDRK
tara:strand:+ start:145 stop:594 length:450 start_codon:yes stop_codon:yes gene_type:complete